MRDYEDILESGYQLGYTEDTLDPVRFLKLRRVLKCGGR